MILVTTAGRTSASQAPSSSPRQDGKLESSFAAWVRTKLPRPFRADPWRLDQKDTTATAAAGVETIVLVTAPSAAHELAVIDESRRAGGEARE